MSKSLVAGYTGSGGAVMDKLIYRPLDMKKLQDKKHSLTTCEEALKDILPIQWEDDVLSGTKKVLLIDKEKRN